MARDVIDRLIDRDAEEATLGAMLISVDAIERAAAIISGADFGNLNHTVIFDAVLDLYRRGDPADPTTVAGRLDETNDLDRVGGKNALLTIQAATPASANVGAYATRVAELADRRRLAVIGAELNDVAKDQTVDLDRIRDSARAEIDGIARAGSISTHASFADWSPTVTMGYDWIVPDVLESRDRLIVVASEGAGKSFLLRQWALMCAAGAHWFRNEKMPTKRALIIDVENSARQIVRNTKRMYDFARARHLDFSDDDYTIVPIGTSIDITSRGDRLRVEQYLAGHRPDVLVIGPLYKLMRMVRKDSSYEEQAALITDVLDNWRERYGVALLIEHHAAKASGGHRSLDPLGSSMFLRWPEFVLTMEIDENNRTQAILGHARGQREQRSWPERIQRSMNGWPWAAVDQQEF